MNDPIATFDSVETPAEARAKLDKQNHALLHRVLVPRVLAVDANGVEMFKTLNGRIYARTTDGVIHRYPPKVRKHRRIV